MEYIMKKGKFMIFDKNENIIPENSYKINWFKISQSDISNEDLDKYSRLWVNKVKYNCKYSSSIMDKIDDMENNLYSDTAEFKH